MIKLIISDLDGTLLTPDGKLPEKIFPLIRKLKEKSILFCAASGRQLVTLRHLFEPVKDDILYIAENGAVCAIADTVLRSLFLSRKETDKILSEVSQINHIYPLYCTIDCAYYQDDDKTFTDFINASYFRSEKKNFDLLSDILPCKIAVFDELGPENNGFFPLTEKLKGLRVIQSGNGWMDVSDPRANKGDAVTFLQKHLGISYEECAAFGDHMNDYEMLLACKHAFVPENAYPFLKEKFSNIIPSNKEGGVLQQIEKILATC